LFVNFLLLLLESTLETIQFHSEHFFLFLIVSTIFALKEKIDFFQGMISPI